MKRLIAAVLLIPMVAILLVAAPATLIDLTNQVRGILPIANGGTGTSSGVVTSVGLSMPAGEFSVSGSPVTGASTLTVSKAPQSPNLIAAGPTNGANTSIVQSASGVCDGCGPGSITVAFPNNVTATHLLIFVVEAFGIVSVTTSAGDTLSTTTSVGNGVSNEIAYTCSAVGGATSVTLTGTRSAQLHIYEIQGNATASCLDANGTGGGSSVSVTSLSVATSGSVSQANEFVIAAFNTNFSTATAITMGSGYQSEQSTFGSGTASGNVATVSGQGNANSGLSGVQTATATTNLTAAFWNGMIATFKLNTSTSTAPWTFRPMVCADLPAHIPCPIFAQTKTAQVAAITDFSMATAPTGGQLYRFTGTVNCTTISAAATATLNVKYTDTASTAQTVSVTDTCTALVTSGIPNLVLGLRAKAATAITYGVTIANTPTYDVDVRLEQLQ